MIVVDASVAVKWFLKEAGSADAERLLIPDASPMHAPDLLLVEVTATFIRIANQKVVSKQDATRIIKSWMSVCESGQVQVHRIDARLIARAADLALDLGHPLKDCIYLALAIELDCPLLTADVRFQARAAGRHPAVELLG